MTVLVSGFDTFGDNADNPSEQVVRRLVAAGVAGVVVPTSYAGSWAALQAAIVEHRPTRLLMLGLAASIEGARVETTGRSAVTSAAPDNDGEVWTARQLGDADTLPATVDVAGIVDVFAQHSIPTTISNDAGGYVCNALLYRALADAPVPIREIGFVHIGAVGPGTANDLDRYVAAITQLTATTTTPDL